MNPEDYSRRRASAQGWELVVISYRLGADYFCTVSHVDSGATLAREKGPDRDPVERIALERAGERLARTRRRSTA